MPTITIAEFANTVDPDETVHYEPSHLDLQDQIKSISILGPSSLTGVGSSVGSNAT